MCWRSVLEIARGRMELQTEGWDGVWSMVRRHGTDEGERTLCSSARLLPPSRMDLASASDCFHEAVFLLRPLRLLLMVELELYVGGGWGEMGRGGGAEEMWFGKRRERSVAYSGRVGLGSQGVRAAPPRALATYASSVESAGRKLYL